jgi:hypothetical protein
VIGERLVRRRRADLDRLEPVTPEDTVRISGGCITQS